MKTLTKQAIGLLCAAVIFHLAGCNPLAEQIVYPSAPAAATLPQQPSPPTPQQTEQLARRFADSNAQTDAVQTAVEWAKKYEQLLEKNVQLQQQVQQLFAENTQLKSQLQQCQTDLARTEKELQQTNEFLGQLHGELSKWKTDVLGFRDEMRQTQAAQMEALRRILQILGAEPISIPAPAADKQEKSQ